MTRIVFKDFTVVIADKSIAFSRPMFLLTKKEFKKINKSIKQLNK